MQMYWFYTLIWRLWLLAWWLLIDDCWLNDWLDCSFVWLIVLLVYPCIHSSMRWLFECFNLILSEVAEWLIDRLIGMLIVWLHWFIDYLIDWLLHWWIDRLVDRLIHMSDGFADSWIDVLHKWLIDKFVAFLDLIWFWLVDCLHWRWVRYCLVNWAKS